MKYLFTTEARKVHHSHIIDVSFLSTHISEQFISDRDKMKSNHMNAQKNKQILNFRLQNLP